MKFIYRNTVEQCQHREKFILYRHYVGAITKIRYECLDCGARITETNPHRRSYTRHAPKPQPIEPQPSYTFALGEVLARLCKPIHDIGRIVGLKTHICKD